MRQFQSSPGKGCIAPEEQAKATKKAKIRQLVSKFYALGIRLTLEKY
jgi:hypothetical protein